MNDEPNDYETIQAAIGDGFELIAIMQSKTDNPLRATIALLVAAHLISNASKPDDVSEEDAWDEVSDLVHELITTAWTATYPTSN